MKTILNVLAIIAIIICMAFYLAFCLFAANNIVNEALFSVSGISAIAAVILFILAGFCKDFENE